mmetsp:Transcript_9224/g.42024  ORF Transcript_9224/g.42024 Transcript_9224/m.42024 type:complete len:273 (+) Transcript_9224:455-1273(+)
MATTSAISNNAAGRPAPTTGVSTCSVATTISAHALSATSASRSTPTRYRAPRAPTTTATRASTWTALRASPARLIRRAPAGPRRRARAPRTTGPRSPAASGRASCAPSAELRPRPRRFSVPATARFRMTCATRTAPRTSTGTVKCARPARLTLSATAGRRRSARVPRTTGPSGRALVVTTVSYAQAAEPRVRPRWFPAQPLARLRTPSVLTRLRAPTIITYLAASAWRALSARRAQIRRLRLASAVHHSTSLTARATPARARPPAPPLRARR